MLSDCLENYIGIQGTCSDVTSESGLYINTLPSISLKLLANLSDEETKDFTGLWNEIYARSVNMLESDVLIKAQKYFKTNLLLDNQQTGYYADPLEVVTASNELKGNTIECYYNTSRYLSIYVNSVQLYLPSAINGNIYIYNLMNGALLDTIAYTGVVGINVIQINKTYKSYGQDTKIFVCYDGNTTNSIETVPIDGSNLAITNGAKIAVGTTVLNASLTRSGEAYGLIVDYNLKCDISEFICSSKDLFKFAFWWKLGSQIMFDRMNSDRMNKYTLNKTKVELKDLYNYYEDNYDKIMESVLDNLEKNSDQVCFSCRKQRNYKYLMP